MTAGYRPISCSVHDRLEALAVRSRPCRIRHRTPEGAVESAEGRIVDIFARQGEEFLRMDGGEEIRLDRLVEVEDAGPTR